MEYQYWLHIAMKELVICDSPKLDAEILLMHITGKSRSFIAAFGETQLTFKELNQLDILLARRKIGEPIAYITGEREFWSLPFYVSPATLIPRPDTECLVEQALLKMPAVTCRILDIGTGTGVIALSLASERPDCQVVAVDLLPSVVTLAKRNAVRLNLKNVNIQQSYWFNGLNNEFFEIIISNPPYIDKDDPQLKLGDVRFEPRIALIADNNGFAAIDYIITHARRHLISGGWLLIEHGWKQGEMVRDLFNRKSYCNISTCYDYSRNERLTLGQIS